jgi:NAD(P)H dehydrogenase (quinone)
MQNLLGYGGDKYVTNGVIRHYVGKARLSWVDIEDVAAVAAASLLNPEKHHGKTYRMGYEALTCDEIAKIFTKTLDQPFSYEARSPDEFYASVLAAGAEPAYMKCVHDSFADFTAGRGEKVDETFDNLPTILGRQPRTVADFAKKNAEAFRY